MKRKLCIYCNNEYIVKSKRFEQKICGEFECQRQLAAYHNNRAMEKIKENKKIVICKQCKIEFRECRRYVFCSEACRLVYLNSYGERDKEKKHINYLNNKDKVKAYNKNYNMIYKDELSIEHQIYYSKNSEHKKQYTKQWSSTPRGKILTRLSQTERRHRLKNIKHEFSTKEWEDKVNLTGGICPVCNIEFGKEYKNQLTMDHEPAVKNVPVGYTYKIHNVFPMCRSCNASKGIKEISYFLMQKQKVKQCL